MFPSEFGYLKGTAMKYGVDEFQIIQNRDAIIGRLTERDLTALAQAHKEIRSREDAMAISNWLNGAPAEERPHRDWRSVWLLFQVFEELADRGVVPFVSREVRHFDPPKPKLDWEKLPPQLHYIAEAAEKYGTIQFDSQIDAFREKITPEQIEQLAAIAKLANADIEAFRAWVDEYDMMEHPEAARVYFFLTLLNALGLM